MYDYIYAREIDSTGKYNVDNTLYVDGGGDMIHLCNQLAIDMPGIVFCSVGNGSSLIVKTDIELDSGQQTTLTANIATYKAQTGA